MRKAKKDIALRPVPDVTEICCSKQSGVRGEAPVRTVSASSMADCSIWACTDWNRDENRARGHERGEENMAWAELERKLRLPSTYRHDRPEEWTARRSPGSPRR